MSRLRNASVGIATVTQESFESHYDVARTPSGARTPFTMTVPLDSFASESLILSKKKKLTIKGVLQKQSSVGFFFVMSISNFIHTLSQLKNCCKCQRLDCIDG